MDVNISGPALVRLAFWLAVTAVVVGIVIGAQTREPISTTPAPVVHPAGQPAAEAANDR